MLHYLGYLRSDSDREGTPFMLKKNEVPQKKLFTQDKLI